MLHREQCQVIQSWHWPLGKEQLLFPCSLAFQPLLYSPIVSLLTETDNESPRKEVLREAIVCLAQDSYTEIIRLQLAHWISPAPPGFTGRESMYMRGNCSMQGLISLQSHWDCDVPLSHRCGVDLNKKSQSTVNICWLAVAMSFSLSIGISGGQRQAPKFEALLESSLILSQINQIPSVLVTTVTTATKVPLWPFAQAPSLHDGICPLAVCMTGFALAAASVVGALWSPDGNYFPCMLQLDVSVTERCGRLLQERCDPKANFPCSNNCRIHSHGADCYRPVPEVMAEHPGADGYCYFNATAFGLVYPGPVTMVEAANNAIETMRGSDYRGLNQGLLITYKFDGQEISTHMDTAHYLYDDLYGYSLGFLQGQGLQSSVMWNSKQWTLMSEQICHSIQEEFNFSNPELVLADWLDFNQAIAVMTACSAGLAAPGSSEQSVLDLAGWRSPMSCRPVSRRDFAKHHYVKCQLGFRNSAMDMAYLNSRACLLEGKRIGHLSECPYSPDLTL
eukprot:s32_g19.t1